MFDFKNLLKCEWETKRERELHINNHTHTHTYTHTYTHTQHKEKVKRKERNKERKNEKRNEERKKENLYYDERLKIHNIDRLEIRRIKFDLVLFYKILNKILDMDTCDFFLIFKYCYQG